jgi:hypothetical protein
MGQDATQIDDSVDSANVHSGQTELQTNDSVGSIMKTANYPEYLYIEEDAKGSRILESRCILCFRGAVRL